MQVRVHTFRSRRDREVHAVIAFHGRKVRRTSRTVCTQRVQDMIRLVPHTDPSKEPGITCVVCLTATVGLMDLFEQPVRDWPVRKPKGQK